MRDKLENHLHAMVCSGEISLQDAQHEIATDWVAARARQIGKYADHCGPATMLWAWKRDKIDAGISGRSNGLPVALR